MLKNFAYEHHFEATLYRPLGQSIKRNNTKLEDGLPHHSLYHQTLTLTSDL